MTILAPNGQPAIAERQKPDGSSASRLIQRAAAAAMQARPGEDAPSKAAIVCVVALLPSGELRLGFDSTATLAPDPLDHAQILADAQTQLLRSARSFRNRVRADQAAQAQVAAAAGRIEAASKGGGS